MVFYWSRCDCISINQARENWFNLHQDADMEPLPNLLNKNDRIQYIRYLFTGEIFSSTQTNEIGNKTMFQLQETLKNYEKLYENIFNYYTTLNQNELSFKYTKSLMHTFEVTFNSKIEILKKYIANKYIICYFYLKKISHMDKSLILSINQKDAYNIDWSNLPDYFNNESFLKMARACSTKNTVHCCYFLNWTQKIFGSSIIDYDDKKKILEHANKSKKIMKEVYGTFLESIYKGFMNTDLILFPLNDIDMILHRQFQSNFIKFFFDISVNLGSPVNELFNVFLKSSSFFSISFTFNKEINK